MFIDVRGGNEYPTITVVSNSFNGYRAISIAMEAVKLLKDSYGIYTLIDIINEGIINSQDSIFESNSRIIVGKQVFDIQEDEAYTYDDLDETVYTIVDAVLSYIYNSRGDYDYDELSVLKNGNRNLPSLGEVAILE